MEDRLELRAQGQVEFLGGKQELIRLGEFDDVDVAVMCHTASDMGDRKFVVGGTSNGHIVKYVQFTGRGAHAGAAPHLGINALNAAAFALQAINANRETHQADDTVRVHGIMTKGGEAVNAVPADVKLEWRVRSATPEAVVKNAAVVDRCFRAGALAVGASVQITNIPGYLPMRHDTGLQDLFRRNAQDLLGESNILVMPPRRNRGGSTDMGDLSHLIPACHPYTGGAVGAGHSKEYLINDYQQAVINPAKIMAMLVIDLLADGGAKGKEVMQNHRPRHEQTGLSQLPAGPVGNYRLRRWGLGPRSQRNEVHRRPRGQRDGEVIVRGQWQQFDQSGDRGACQQAPVILDYARGRQHGHHQ